METLKKLYEEQIVPNLTKKFNYTTKMQVPKLDKIVLNMGVGDATIDQKYLDAAIKDLEALSGQKPVVTKAKKSIAGFKLREGNKIGCKVTLRGDNMYNFLNKLITIALPRVRDFRGISKNSFDGRRDSIWDRSPVLLHLAVPHGAGIQQVLSKCLCVEHTHVLGLHLSPRNTFPAAAAKQT